ncbi:Protein CBG07319 [Caenorhabditis briggsae]|uniref:Protein CBG07319 n=1 Tax=Caenorhabditis briggsae TaxID=6238 RepID=A8X508_CAEBR|nr:Protein CBG07319 [Caenorhabditis briggsae]CAP27718.2 Protein CBG07319 [Caenorhabditis briggsae]
MSSRVQEVQHAYSIAGFLQMKYLGGALALWRPRRRFYFAIDEIVEELVYHKSEVEFCAHREPLGTFPISSSVITLDENNHLVFILHTSGRSIEFEADNQESCRAWLNTFCNRYSEAERAKYQMMTHRKVKRAASLPVSTVILFDFPCCMSKPQNSESLLQDQESTPPATDQHIPFRKHSVPARNLMITQNFIMPPPDIAVSYFPFFTLFYYLLFQEGYLPDEEMDDWVTHWLTNEKFQNFASCTDMTTPTSTNQSKGDTCSESERAESEELELLREVTNNQKKKIEEMKHEMNAMTMHIEQMRKRNDSGTGADRDTLSTQNKFLNSEILRMSAKCEILSMQSNGSSKENKRLAEELQLLRCDYVYAIQSTIRIPLHDNSAMDVMSVKLLGGDTHKSRLIQLMAEARQHDPSLPTLQSLLQGIYVDSFGFRINFKEEPNALHYMATKLNHFYLNRSKSANEHKSNWKRFLEENDFIDLTPETKVMCRKGIPNSLRATVWRILINQQVEDLKNVYGKYYYRNLCNIQGGEDEKLYSDVHQKQIYLDLLRTMPNNVHFMSANSKGITQLLQVLHAFCLHNSQIGYCQGMNFLAATALLFVGPEDAFWFLIAITERYFDKTYFDSNLTGAQADQEVLKNLLEVQHPRIMTHLKSLEIDVASFTLNWFIALFFDSVPFNVRITNIEWKARKVHFQTLLRIWDCFLLEGPKVLFRFALVLIGKHEEEIISRTDTIGIMRVSKAASKLAYDEEAIVNMAFHIQNLPTRGELKSMQQQYVSLLAEKLEKKTKRANEFVKSIASNLSNEKLISNIFIDQFTPNTGFIVSGHHLMGKIAAIKVVKDKGTMKDIDVEFDCRVMSICMVRKDMAYVSLISGYLIAAHVSSDNEWSILWELKLPDVATFLIHRENTLFAGLANGILTVFENAGERWPTSVQMWHMPLSSSPLMNAAVHDDTLVVATACKLITLDAQSLTNLSTTHVASSNVGSGVIHFDKITCMSESNFGIFLTTDHSNLIQLWQDTTCNLLYDISFDHKTRKPSLSEADNSSYVESMLFNDGILWLGTSDGYIFIYNVDNERGKEEVKYKLKRFPGDKRNSRRGSSARSQRLGSLPEDDDESDDSIPTFCTEKRASRVSISIDRETQQYSGKGRFVFFRKKSRISVASFQQNNNTEEQDFPGSNSSRLNSTSSKTMRFPMKKGFSADSAVSVFSSEPNELIEKIDENLLHVKKDSPRFRDNRFFSSTNSSCTSMEYDDTFELYSDEERSRRKVAIQSHKKLSGRNCFHFCICHKKLLSVIPKHVNLHRKDLTFDDPYVVPIRESADKELSNDVEDSAVVSSVKLTLFMKLKISETSVRKIICSGENHILTCSGEFGADEAVLLWRKDLTTNLWINDPVLHENQASKTNNSTPSSVGRSLSFRSK